jgi:hypothetical protein
MGEESRAFSPETAMLWSVAKDRDEVTMRTAIHAVYSMPSPGVGNVENVFRPRYHDSPNLTQPGAGELPVYRDGACANGMWS